MSRAAAVGKYDSIYGFRSVGMEIFPVDTAEECAEAVKKVTEFGYGILFLTEEFAYLPEVRELLGKTVPAVLVIPDATGSRHLAIQELHQMVEKAAGADLLGNE